MAKLTLHVREDLVAVAKSEAATRRVSVSKLVSDYFARFAAGGRRSDSEEVPELSPRTRRLAGIIPTPDADMEDYIDHLERKHS